MVYRGTFKNGVIVLDEPADIRDGQQVNVEPVSAAVRKTSKMTATQRLLEIAGVIKDGPTDASVNHDHYIYGSPKRESK